MTHPLPRIVFALMLVGVVGVAGCASEDPVAVDVPATTTTSTTAAPAPTTTALPRAVPVEPRWTDTAIPNGKIQGFDGPNGLPTQEVTNTYYDIPTTLPVIERVDGWLHVRLAPRPNGSTIWVREADVAMGRTPWRIVINLTTSRLQLYKVGILVLDAPVGIGTDYTPTATGDFFVTHFQDPPNAGYGPFVMVISGHSNVLQSFNGFPDAILAIHGPIGSDEIIGTTGAKISNGCIRMHMEDQRALADVQAGSLVQIIES